MRLKEKCKETLKRLEITDTTGKFLLAVSGGIDSMVMMHLFNALKLNCTIAHCNFQLRGQESDDDEAFVREQASKLYFKIFVTRFETEEYAEENHLSIQMAARELRYTWFDKLQKVHQFDYITVAHTRDDAIETFFINLGRGSGIAGLTGIRPIAGKILRPLINISRAEIEEYAKESQIPHREDSSNASDKYLRNYIRHQIIPGFEEAFPNFRETMSLNLEKLNDTYLIYQQNITNEISSVVKNDKDLVFINIPGLLSSITPKTLLYEIVKNYGFTSPMLDEMMLATQGISGKQFLSTTHKMVKDRECFIISGIEPENQTRCYIDKETTELDSPIHLSFEQQTKTVGFTIIKDASIALLDYDKLEFPLILRKWLPGDYFMPLGMTGMKKVSDFFVDLKLSLIEKENTWLLTSGNHIVWIVGKRIDNRYKITETSVKLLKISLLQ